MLAQDESPYRASISEEMALWKARPYLLRNDAAELRFPREKLGFWNCKIDCLFPGSVSGNFSEFWCDFGQIRYSR